MIWISQHIIPKKVIKNGVMIASAQDAQHGPPYTSNTPRCRL